MKKTWPQYLIAVAFNLGTLSFGIHVGWLAPIQLLLQSEESPLAPHIEPLTLEEVSWIGAIPTISLLVGPFLCGYFLEKTGRKFTALLITIPNIISYLLLLYHRHIYVIYTARLLSGFAACMFIIAPMYVTESAQDNKKGFLSSLTGIFLNIGVFLGYVLGSYTSYTTLNIIGLLFPLSFLLFYLWIPESPQYLIIKNRHEEAIQALLKLRGGTKEEQEEEVVKLCQLVKKKNKKSTVASAMRHRSFIRGVGTMIGLFTIQSCCGVAAVITYNVFILRESGSDVDPPVAAIFISAMQICGTVLGSVLIERFGRRKLLLVSSLLVFCSLSSFTVYLHMHQQGFLKELGWLPMVALAVYIFTYASGFGTVGHVLLPELFLPQARPFASGLCGTWLSLMMFFILKFFPIIAEIISLKGVFLAFTLSAGLGFVYIYLVIFETKGKTPMEINTQLGGRIKSNTTEEMPMAAEFPVEKQGVEMKSDNTVHR